MNTRAILDDVYARIPRIDCRGLCFECCGPIALHVEEKRRMERHGRVLTFSGETGRCSMLNAANRCDVYRDRPLVCRIWGVVENLPCPHGCVPERVLTKAEGYALMVRQCDALGWRIEPSLPDGDWTAFEIRHRQFLHRTLQYGPVHVPWPTRKANE